MMNESLKASRVKLLSNAEDRQIDLHAKATKSPPAKASLVDYTSDRSSKEEEPSKNMGQPDDAVSKEVNFTMIRYKNYVNHSIKIYIKNRMILFYKN
jgi:hypothetical protein